MVNACLSFPLIRTYFHSSIDPPTNTFYDNMENIEITSIANATNAGLTVESGENSALTVPAHGLEALSEPIVIPEAPDMVTLLLDDENLAETCLKLYRANETTYYTYTDESEARIMPRIEGGGFRGSGLRIYIIKQPQPTANSSIWVIGDWDAGGGVD